jgi:hypothetical protein
MGHDLERIDRPNVYLSFLTIMDRDDYCKLCEALALLLFAALAPDSNAAAQPAGPTMAVSASQQMKERHVHSCRRREEGTMRIILVVCLIVVGISPTRAAAPTGA